MKRPGARPCDFTGREMKGFVLVDYDAGLNSRALTGWVDLALAFVATLPPKPDKRKKAR